MRVAILTVIVLAVISAAVAVHQHSDYPSLDVSQAVDSALHPSTLKVGDNYGHVQTYNPQQ